MKTKKLLKVISIILAVIMFVQIIPTSVFALAADELTETETIEPDISEEVEEETPEAVILGEDESRREESVKHYIMSDHTYKAVMYSNPVHYKTDGEWVDIDNTLADEEAQDSDDVNGFVNKSNGFKIKFAKKSNGKKLVSIKKDKYGLSWGYDSNSKNKVDAVIKEKVESDLQFAEYVSDTSSSVIYEDIDTNLSLEYNVIGNKVKENIIVKSKSDEYTYNFELKAQNVTFKTNEDGSIDVLAEDTSELIFAIPTPFMYDSENRISNDVQYTLTEQNGNKITLTVTADAEWINSQETVFPVTIDPMIETERSRNDIDSTFVASGSAYKTQNMTAIHDLYVGWDTANYQHMRALIKFNLPALYKGDLVVGATLELNFKSASVFGDDTTDQQIDAHVITSSWDNSTVTWNNKPSYDSTIYDYDFIKRSDVGCTGNKRFDITKAVKGWFEGTFENNGILIKQHVEDGEARYTAANMKFHSERYETVASNFPIIAISYLNNKGLENYWSYTSIGVEDAGTAYINDYTGNLVFVNEIASISSERSDLSLRYVYNGYAAGTKFIAKGDNVNTSAGHGWIINILQTIRPSSLYGLTGTKASDYPYVYTDGDGTEHYIYKKDENGSTKYVDEEGLGLTLTLGGSSDTWKYRLTDEDDNVYSFNSIGNLYEMSDANGNTTSITYDSTGIELKKVTDAVGHTYTFTQSSDAQYITTITDTSGRVTSFNYGGNGKPAKITFPDGTYVNYTYDEDNCLKTATASNGYKITFEYNGKTKGKRVKSVTETGSDGTEGQVITFDRSKHNTTTITTNGIDGVSETADDLITTYQFDNFGRTITQKVTSAYGEESVAGMYNYISLDEDTHDNVRQVNRVTSDASLGKNIVNLVSGVNGESLSGWTKKNTNTTASVTYSSDEKYVGANSLMINISEISQIKGNGLLYQTVSATGGKTYTFSAYVKTVNIIEKYPNDWMGAYLQLRPLEGTTKIDDYFSESISFDTSEAMNNGWRRLSVTVTLPTEATNIQIFLGMRNVTGTAYFDCIQVEENDTVNDCNLLENAGFETVSSGVPAKWSTTTATATDDGSSTTSPYDGSQVVKITGDSSTIKNYKQVVNVFGSADDTYIVSGWAKADAVSQLYHEDALFEVGVLVQYAQSVGGKAYTEAKEAAKFNTSISDWQYSAQAFTLKSTKYPSYTPQYITVYVKYNYQANCAYFDNIQLIKDVAQTYTYNDEGELISVAANAEQESQMEYTNSNLAKYTDSKGYNYTYVYDDYHNLTKATSAKGVVTGYTYNSDGQVETAELRNKADSSAATVAIKAETCYYDATGDIAEGSYVNKTFDSHGRETKYVYDVEKGLLNSVETPDGVKTEYTYIANNDNLETVSSIGTTVDYSYSNNRLSSIQIFEPYVDEEYSFVYDAFGNVKQTKVGSTALLTNNYGSNNGILQSTSYGNGDTVSYTYDYYGNITGINQNSTESFKWKYDSSLRPISHFDYRNNLKYNYDYDSIGRLIRQELRTSDSNNTHVGSTEFSYDVRNNLTGIVNTMGGHEMEQYYSYSAVSTSANSADYEKDNLPTQYKVSDSRRAEYTYDSINRLTSRAFTTVRPINNNYVYWSSNRNENGSTKYRTTLLKYEFVDNDAYFYNYDEVGNITEIQKGEREVADSISSKTPANLTAYRSYKYDDYNQLIREDNVTSGKTTLFNYDGLGNILSKEEYDYTAPTVTNFGTADKIIEYTYSNDGKSGWNNLLTSVDLNGNGTVSSSETISYDAIGNPVTYLGKTLSWFGRQLITFVNGSKTVTNTYDADGHRGTKTVNNKTTTYQYIDGKLFYEGRSDVKLYYYYDSYGNLAAVRYILPDGENEEDGTNKIYYVTTNVQGDVLGIYESDGDQVAAYEYDTWGNRKIYSVTQVNGENVFTEVTYSQAIALNPVLNNSIGYRGYYYDTDMELYYLGSRYYDPMVGRFINADSESLLTATPTAIFDKNLFAYCDNNPITRADYAGEAWHIVAGAAIGAVTSFVSTAVFYSNEEDKVLNRWAEAGIAAGFGAVSGAISAGCPVVSPYIDAALSAASDITIGCLNKNTAGEIIINVAISIGTSFIPFDTDGILTQKGSWDYVSGLKIKKETAYRPKIRKEATKELKRFSKKLVKEGSSQVTGEMVISLCYSLLEVPLTALFGYKVNLS